MIIGSGQRSFCLGLAADDMERILHYDIAKKLGVGKNGPSYLAMDTGFQRAVVLKFLNHPHTQAGEWRTEFKSQAEREAAVDDERLVRFYSLEEADGQLFIVREYIDGKSLDDLVKNSPLSYARMLRVGLELATVIKKLHENGLVHGNITAANLFTDDRERSRLTDLGLGLPVETWPANVPASIHDIPFLAPEILEGGRASFATDQYAIGAVLYQMLTGQPPFYDEDPQTLIQAVLQEPVSFEIRPLSSVPGVARLLIGKLLSKNPEDRFVSTDELLFTLQGMLSLGAKPAPVTTEKKWTPSPRLYMLISVLAILLVILWLVVSNSSG